MCAFFSFTLWNSKIRSFCNILFMSALIRRFGENLNVWSGNMCECKRALFLLLLLLLLVTVVLAYFSYFFRFLCININKFLHTSFRRVASNILAIVRWIEWLPSYFVFFSKLHALAIFRARNSWCQQIFLSLQIVHQSCDFNFILFCCCFVQQYFWWWRRWWYKTI